jgi:general secretion pathway protein M
VAAWENSLAALRPLRGQIQATTAGAPAATNQNQSLVVIVDNSLRQRGLYNSLQRSLPTPAGNGIRVEFESAAFDDLILWLGDLHRQYGLQVENGSFTMASGNIPGRVNSSVTLER